MADFKLGEEWIDVDRLIPEVLPDPTSKLRGLFQMSREEWNASSTEKQNELRDFFTKLYMDEQKQRQETREFSAEQQTGLPLRKTPEGEQVELGAEPFSLKTPFAETGVGVRSEIMRSADLEDQAEIAKRHGYNAYRVEPPDTDPYVIVQRPGEKDAVMLDSDSATWLDTAADVVIPHVLTGENVAATASSFLFGPGKFKFLTRVAGIGSAGLLAALADEAHRRKIGVTNDVDSVWAMGLRNYGLSFMQESMIPLLNRRFGTSLNKHDRSMVEDVEFFKDAARRGGFKMPGAMIPDRGALSKYSAQQTLGMSYSSRANILQRQEGMRVAFERLAEETGGDLTRLSESELEYLFYGLHTHLGKLLSKDISNLAPDKAGLAVVTGAIQEGRDQMGQLIKARFAQDYKNLHNLVGDAAWSYGHVVTRRSGQPPISVKDLARELKEGVPFAKENDWPVVAKQIAREYGFDLGEPPLKLGQLRKPSPEMLRVIDKIMEAKELTVGLKNADGLTQVQTLRREIMDAKYARIPGHESADEHIAGELYDALTQMMDNPINASPDLLKVLRPLNEKYAQMMEVLEIPLVKEWSLTHEPTAVLINMFRPQNERGLQWLSDLLPNKAMQEAKDGLIFWLREHPEQINGTLDSFRGLEPLRRRFISDEAAAALRAHSRHIEQVSKGPVARALKEGVAGLDVLTTTFKDLSPASRNQLAEAIEKAGGRNSDFGLAMQRGTMLFISKTAQTGQKFAGIVDTEAAGKIVAKLGESGFIDTIFEPVLADRLKSSAYSLQRLVNVGKIDVGGAMQRGSVAADLFGVFELGGGAVTGEAAKGPLRSVRAIGTIVKNWVVGHALFGKASERAMLQAAGQKGELGTRIMAVLTSRLFNSVIQSDPQQMSGRGKAALIDLWLDAQDSVADIISNFNERQEERRRGNFDELEDEE